MPISREALQKIKEENSCDIFFETGFYKGEGVEHALSLGFEKVFSIELLREFYDEGCKMFEKEISKGRVNLIADCSSKLSSYIGNLVDRKVMFWFDAHIDNNGTPTTNDLKICPLIEEISSLSVFNQKPVILVDDIRIVRGDPQWGPQAWGEKNVNLQAILERIDALPFDYKTYYIDGHHPTLPLVNDILVAV